MSPPPASSEALLRYGDGDFDIVRSGRFVVCAVSQKQIPLESLRYWSASLQEAYASPVEACQRLAPRR